MKRSQLSRFLVEGLVIVLSILLALGLEAAWGERQDRAAERRALLAIDGEILRNLDLLAQNMVFIETSQEAYRWFMDRSPDDVAAIEDEMRGPVSAAIGSLAYFEPELGVLTSLINSGRISLIQNPDIAAALTTWTLIIDRTAVQRDMNARAQREVTLAAPLGYYSAATPTRLGGGSFADIIPDFLPAMRQSPLFVERWSTVIGMEIGYGAGLQNVVAHAEGLRESIADELATRW